jgi:Na+-transporting NADH:ubiquinone oxidoreductase subunit NqrC
MQTSTDESGIETPIALAIIVLVMGSLIFFGARYWMKARAQDQRERNYQSTLLTYRQALKPGITRREVEGYLHSHQNDFQVVDLNDVLQVGQDKSTLFFCEGASVVLEFYFIASKQVHGEADVASDQDTLKGIDIVRIPGACW